MSIQKVISNPVVVNEIAKYLAPKDFLSVRLVSSSWTAAFERPLFKHVPVILDDFIIRAFLVAEGGEFRPRRMKNEFFKILTWMHYPREGAAVLDVCKVFGPQMKKLEVRVNLGAHRQLRVLCKALTALNNTLEELSVLVTRTQFAGKMSYNNHQADEFQYGKCIFPVMTRLKTLSFNPVPEERAADTSDKWLVSFVTTSCPNLKKLQIGKFPGFQEDVFRQLNEARKSFNLESLILEKCSGSVMQDISKVPFTPLLRYLRFKPYSEYDERSIFLPGPVNKVLNHVSQNLTSLYLQLVTLFEKKADENGRFEFLTLPVMPKLRTLFLESIEPYSDHSCLDLRYEESFTIGNFMFPSLTAMYPELISLRIKNTSDVDLVSSLICLESPPHEGIRYLDIYDRERKQGWRKLVLRKVKQALPNAMIKFSRNKAVKIKR